MPACCDCPPGLQLLASWWVIGRRGVLFAVEFFADKVPAFDLLWNALQTFVRVPVAAFLAYGATSQLSPEKQLLATLVGGAIALAAHGGKTAVRAAVTPSPEPFSNISLSLGEDALAIFLTWFATTHPYVAASICPRLPGCDCCAGALGGARSAKPVSGCRGRTCIPPGLRHFPVFQSQSAGEPLLELLTL